MATQLFTKTKDGSVINQLFPAERVQAHLNTGWVCDPDDLNSAQQSLNLPIEEYDCEDEEYEEDDES